MVRHMRHGAAYGIMYKIAPHRLLNPLYHAMTQRLLHISVLLGTLLVLSAWGTLPPAVQAPSYAPSGDPHVRIAAVQYGGGGDWYQAETPLPTFLSFVREHTAIDIAPEGDVVELGADRLYTYPFLVMSGHGNVRFTNREAERLRHYLENGGFLLIDDDYGLDEYIRPELAKVFPDQELVELPYSHPIYNHPYDFSDGPPKLHEHDGDPPQGFGIVHNGRVVVYYLHESNITDGWEPASVHDTPADLRREAREMGVNVLTYALTH